MTEAFEAVSFVTIQVPVIHPEPGDACASDNPIEGSDECLILVGL